MSRSGPYSDDEKALHMLLHHTFEVTGGEDLTEDELQWAKARLDKVLERRALLSPETQR